VSTLTAEGIATVLQAGFLGAAVLMLILSYNLIKQIISNSGLYAKTNAKDLMNTQLNTIKIYLAISFVFFISGVGSEIFKMEVLHTQEMETKGQPRNIILQFTIPDGDFDASKITVHKKDERLPVNDKGYISTSVSEADKVSIQLWEYTAYVKEKAKRENLTPDSTPAATTKIDDQTEYDAGAM